MTGWVDSGKRELLLFFFPKKEVSRRSRAVRTSAVNGKPHKTLGKPSHGIMFKVGGAKRPKMF